MAEVSDPKEPLMAAPNVKLSTRQCIWHTVLEFSTLSMASVLLIGTIVVNILATLENADDFGFKNTTGHVSDNYTTQITPDGWTFGIWSIIYIWQGLWIVYAWTLSFLPLRSSTVPWTTYLLHAFSSLLNVAWVYVWGNGYPQAAFPIIFLTAIALYIAIGFAAVHLYRHSPLLRENRTSLGWIELMIANVLVINGLVIYAAWLTIATVANFGIVLQYFADLDEKNTGTLMLCILAIEVLTYFVLENTILDRYARYVFVVYPVFIYFLGGVLSKHWGKDSGQNPYFTLVLEVIVSLLVVARIVLWIIFHFFRPLPTYSVNIEVIF